MANDIEDIIVLILCFLVLLLNVAETVLLIQKWNNPKTNYQRLIFSRILSNTVFATCFVIIYGRLMIFRQETNMIKIAKQEIPWAIVCSSMLHSFLMSADRVWAVRFPLKHKVYQHQITNWLFIITVWCLTFSSVLPFLFQPRSIPLKFVTSSLVVAFGLVIILCYVYVLRKVISKECMIYVIKINGRRETVSPCSPKEKKVMTSSLLFVSIFIICNFPFAISYIATKSVTMYVIVLLILNAIMDPLILFCFRVKHKINANVNIRDHTEK